MKRFLVPTLAVLSFLPVALAAPVSVAQQAETIAIQLNEAATVGEACRLTFVIRNGLPSPVRALGLDLVLFDTSDGVSGYTAVDFGELPPGKTRVRQYDVAEGGCTGIARVLLNDIRSCEIEAEAAGDCLPLLSVSSRTGIDLIL